ncbi:MAG TPA: RHS repeat-associated core domain-containing protein [Thermoanaerobaculia bacterium]|nr:RHS repeat-associated core domain-containing protein [Thermoanaerobaculia bacterium]
MDTDALAAAALETTSASLTISYEYGDSLWPDKLTATSRASMVSPGNTARSELTYHATTGAVAASTERGWSGTPPAYASRLSQTSLYDAAGGTAPAFDPGGPFQSAWLSLPQPSGVMRSVDGPRTDVTDVTSFVYYPLDPSVPALLRGRLAAVRNAAGHITRHEHYDVFGNSTRTVDPNGVAMEMSYDGLGRLLTSTTKAVSGCNPSDDPLCATDVTTTLGYASAAGPVQSEERPNGGVTVYGYDSRGRVSAVSRGPAANDLRERIETTYDPLTGKKNLERTLAYEASAWVEKRRQSFAYDSHARLQTVTHADNTAVHYGYDTSDRIASVRDENHAAPNTTYAYDPGGRLASVAQTLAGAAGGGITTSYGYDPIGNLVSVTDPNGNVTTYVYDDFGQMASQQSPVTGATTYAYDSAGNLTQMTDARGATTTRLYDALNRVTSATSTLGASSESVTWSYDDPASGRFAIGRLSSMTDPSGSTAYHYERRGLLRKEARVLTGAQYTYDTAYEYDGDGNRAVIAYPSTQTTVEYGFDHAGRPTSASGTITNATYLPFGPLTSLTFANGTTQTMSYDARYRMTSNTLGTAQSTLAQYAYTYDAAGNITGILDAMDHAYDRTFGYDDLDRLITANTGSALWQRGSYAWDGMGNILSLKLGEVVQGPADPLDLARHRRERLRADENVPLGRTTYFVYDGTTPRLEGLGLLDPAPDGGGGPAVVLNRPVTTDAAGNETAFVATRTYSPRNLLAAVTDVSEPGEPLQHKIEYGYDGRGVRVIRSESPADGPDTTARRYSIYSPELQLLAATYDDGTNVWSLSASDRNIDYEIVWFAGRPVGQITPGGQHLYTFADHLGTPILQTNATAAITWQAEYEPFGNIYEMRTGTRTAQPLRFPGQEFAMNWEGQEENYNIFRWYRSGWGRYSSADPIGLDGGLNLYSYASQSPIVKIDPRGLKTCLIFTRDTFFGIPFTSHMGVWSDGQCTSGNGGCNISGPFDQFLFDPAGSFRARERGSGAVLEGEFASLDDYIQHHRDSGSDVEVYCFETSCCDQEQIRQNGNSFGDPRGFSCARGVTSCIAGIGPFQNITPTSVPGNCRNQILNRRRTRQHHWDADPSCPACNSHRP